MKKIIIKKKILIMLLLTVICIIAPTYKSKAAISGDYVYSKNSKTKTATIKEYTGDDVDVEIPKTLSGYKVNKIDRYAFSKKALMQNVKIPNTIKTINEGAFSECKSLKSITIPDSVTTLENKLFYKCSKLETIKLGKGIKVIPRSIFEECESLINVSLPDSLVRIGSCAFTKCSSLNTLVIPTSVTYIGTFAFSYCTSLINIELNEGIYCLNKGIIEGCSSLEEITIPSTVVEYNNYIFRENKKLKRVIFKNNILNIKYQNSRKDNVFYNNKIYSRIEFLCYENNSFVKSIKRLNYNNIRLKYMTTILATAITINKDTYAITEGTNEKIICSLLPVNTTDSLSYFSDNKKIANITCRGYVYGVAPGITKGTVRATSNIENEISIIVYPKKVNNFCLKSRGTNYIKVKWNSSKNIDGYELFIKTSDGYKKIIDLSSNSLNYTFSNLKSGTKYQFAIKAYKMVDDTKLYSEEYSLLNTFTRPDKVSGFTIKAVGKKEVSTAWKKTKGATGYRMYIYYNKKWKKVATVKDNSYTFKNLKSKKKYKFAVIAIKTLDKTTVPAIDYPVIIVNTR